MKLSTILLALLIPMMSIGQSWNQVASMPTAKHHPVTFSLNGKGFAITGTNAIDFPTDDVYQYDPVTNQWTELGSFPGIDRGFAIGQAYNGKGYLGFGLGLFSYLNDIWEYDPETDSWSQLTTCECSGRRHPAFIIRDDKIYVGLGDDASGDLDDWHVYDMNADTWTQMDDIPGAPRHHPFMFPAGDHVFAGMGHSGNVIYKDWHKFNVETESWETMADFPGEARVAGTQFGHQGKGYVLSGDGDNHSFMPTGEFWEYDPAIDQWTELPPHPGISRWAPGSFVIDGAVYFLAGQNRQTNEVLSDMWSYQLTAPNSTEELKDDFELVIFPNPSNGDVYVENPSYENASLSVYTISGQIVWQSRISDGLSYQNLEGLNTGIYVIALETDDQLLRRKLIIEK